MKLKRCRWRRTIVRFLVHDRGSIRPWSSGPSSVLRHRGGWRDFVLRAGPGRIVNAKAHMPINGRARKRGKG